ncbi:hypothetical protein PI124_g8031 [Phytophthora idaei]|nr:hypothetical protein PI124_g8031 [Phytophthora idaei]
MLEDAVEVDERCVVADGNTLSFRLKGKAAFAVDMDEIKNIISLTMSSEALAMNTISYAKLESKDFVFMYDGSKRRSMALRVSQY